MADMNNPGNKSEDALVRFLIPVGRSGWSIAAGYVGLFSLLCGVLGPVAILFGVLAIRDMKKHPELHGRGRAVFALVAGGLGTIGFLFMFLNAFLS